MSTPIDPPPDEIAPDGSPPPVWDRHAVSWTWVDEEKGYVCDDPNYTGPPANTPGAIPEDRQPFYAFPPTELQQRLAVQPLEDE